MASLNIKPFQLVIYFCTEINFKRMDWDENNISNQLQDYFEVF